MKYKQCKGCQWYNKPYWSIINPCDNCNREKTNIEIITRWQDPTIEEKEKEIARLNNLLKETSQTLSEQTTKAITLKSENKRLNNIINELEHYLKLEKWKSVGGIHLGVINGVLNKLQEIKGSDKE